MSSNIPNRPVIKGDNTAAFGNRFITITVSNPHLYPISKLVAVTNNSCNIANKVFTDENDFQTETIELVINYLSSETAYFNNVNVVNLVAYDSQNRRYTCTETLTFYAKNGVITGYDR